MVSWSRPTDPVKFRHVNETLKLLSVLTQDYRFKEILKREGGKPETMCEVLDRVEARGIEKGIEKGIEQGIEKSRIESIRNVMQNLHLTAKEAMDVLGIPASDRKRYIAKV